MAIIVNQGIVGGESNVIYRFGLIMLLVTFAGGLATIGVGYLASKIGTGFARKIRDAILQRSRASLLLNLISFQLPHLSLEAQTMSNKFRQYLSYFCVLVLMAPFMGVIAIIKAYGLAPSMTWIMAASVVSLITIIAVIFKLQCRNSRNCKN